LSPSTATDAHPSSKTRTSARFRSSPPDLATASAHDGLHFWQYMITGSISRASISLTPALSLAPMKKGREKKKKKKKKKKKTEETKRE
jgi:hypothetical protein